MKTAPNRLLGDVSERRNAPRWLPPALMLLLAGVTWIAFSPALSGRFLNWDDDRNFLQNEAFRSVGVQQLRWAWSTYHLGVWQPAAWVLFGLEHALFGLDPTGYHAVSVGLHCVNTTLLYLLIVRLLRLGPAGPGAPGLYAVRAHLCAGAAALLFAVHPLRVEAVAWVSCQPYLPAVTCFLLATLTYLRVHVREPGAPYPISGMCCIFCLYVLGVAFKAVAITLPAILFVLDVWPLGRWRRTEKFRAISLIEKLPFAAAAIVVSAWAVAAKDFSESRASLHDFDAYVRVAQAASGLWFYIIKTLVPTALGPYYRLPTDLGLSTARCALAGAAVITLATLAIVLRRRMPALLAALLVYLIILLPNLGLIQISQQLAADRYSYLAMTAPMALLAAIMARAQSGSRVVRGAFAASLLSRGSLAAVLIACVLLMGQTRRRCLVWRDSQALWRAALSIDPDCSVAHCNLGEALVQDGQYADASEHLSRAIDLEPSFAFAYSNFGVVLCKARRFADAVACGERSLSIEPGLRGLDLARTHAMLGEAYAGLRRDDEAWRHTRTAERLGLPEAGKMIEYLSKVSTEPATTNGAAEK